MPSLEQTLLATSLQASVSMSLIGLWTSQMHAWLYTSSEHTRFNFLQFIEFQLYINLFSFCPFNLFTTLQVFGQPVFAFVEERVSASYPKNQIINKSYPISLWCQGPTYNLNLFRLMWRTAFLMFTTLASMLLPFFNDILGVLGALAFWPLTVYFPVEMHITRSKTQKWSLKWLLLQGVSLFCLLISVAALVGSIDGVVENLKKYKPFQMHS